MKEIKQEYKGKEKKENGIKERKKRLREKKGNKKKIINHTRNG